MAYAERTAVPASKSKMEIESTLQRYGASEFGYISRGSSITIGFKAKNRTVRMDVPMPEVSEFAETERGRKRRQMAAEAERDAEHRRRWRALLLMIKAKLEAVESGIATFEDEFLPYTVMANGQTVGQWARPQLNEIVTGKFMPELLPGPTKDT